MLALFGGNHVFKSLPFVKNQASEKAFFKFNDVDDITVTLKGRIYALNEKGNLYSYDKRNNDREFSEILVAKPITERLGKRGRRKRLALMVSSSSSGNRLYMVVATMNVDINRPAAAIGLHFKVYGMKKRSKNDSYAWVEVKSFGDSDKVLFVTRDYCFFVAADEFRGCKFRNCIVFSDDAFPAYSEFKSGWNYESECSNQVAVYALDGQGYSLPVEHYPDFPLMLGYPPFWVLQNASYAWWQSQSQPQRESEEDKLIQSDPNREPECEEQTIDILSNNAARAQTTISSPEVGNDMDHVAEEALETEEFEDAIVQTDYMGRMVQASVKKVVTFRFQGLEVESDHFHILQKVWMKHGDIFEESVIRSCDTKTMALASLAKMILILKTNSGKTLTDEQAHYLDSTLSDLQCMQVKVDWLAPFVEKALVMHKSKPLQAALGEFEKAKAMAEEMEQKLLLEIADMKKRLDRGYKVCFWEIANECG